ncbi:MAG: fatty acid desaturase [Flavobacteriales bacterium]|nr:fatty acid desaturase [Flavobacteriales bacterium]
MLTLPANTDPVFAPPDRYSAFDRFLLRLIRDPRDLPFPYLSLKVFFTLVPMAVLLYLPGVTGWLWWTIAVVYFYVNNITYKGPFGLMLHCTTHRALYKPEHNWLNGFIPYVIAPFFGQSPDTYRAHHVGMHHVENNLALDESSTMPYQRDSGWGFLRYYFTFLFTGIWTLVSYLLGRRRNKLAWQAARGEAIFLLMCAALCLVNAPATIAVFILPFMAFRLVAMAGNWVQHTFIDPEDPGNSFRNSITCINVKFNHKCWNDGYHISHHIEPTMHWTDHPRYFREHLADFERERAVVFAGLNYLDVFILLMRDRYDLLAARFVDLGGRFANDAEVEAFLRSRVVPIAFAPGQAAGSVA